MRLADYTDDIRLVALRRKMGATEGTTWRLSKNWTPLPLETWDPPDLGRGSYGPEEIRRSADPWDGTLEHPDIPGLKVVVYILKQRDHEDREYKFHVTWCRTLEDMYQHERWDRYVPTRDRSGVFLVRREVRHGRTREVRVRLRVCENCLSRLHYRGFVHTWPKSRRERAVDAFSIDDYFREYDGVPRLPPYTADSAPPTEYPEDFAEISRRYRESQGWQCEKCHRDFTHPELRQLLDAHHDDASPGNNEPSNLRALCRWCHREEPGHGHMPDPSIVYANLVRKHRLPPRMKPLLDERPLPTPHQTRLAFPTSPQAWLALSRWLEAGGHLTTKAREVAYAVWLRLSEGEALDNSLRTEAADTWQTAELLGFHYKG